ncbi:MAG: hypothetical protein MJD61_06715 [Proteobacteria bacterium]|nr:hypothetical protein [Pseudomonadota bacterium]
MQDTTWARTAGSLLTDTRVWSALAFASVVLLALSALAVPWILARMPADYFVRHGRRSGRGPGAVLWAITKNLLGLLLLAAGIAMLVLPGQGLVTILIATLLLDFPGKRRAQRRLIAWPPLLRAVNALRRRAGQPPFRTDWLAAGERDRWKRPRS